VAVSRNHLETERVRVPVERDPAPEPPREPSFAAQSAELAVESWTIGGVMKKTFGRLLLAFVVAALPLLGFGAKQLVDSGRLWWSQRQAKQSATPQTAGNENAVQTGASSIIAALRASPNDPKILRIWADYLKRNNGPAGDRASALRQVVASAEATTTDRAELACALIAEGKTSEAKIIIDALPESERATVEMLEARATLMDSTGDGKGGDELRREAWSKDVENPESRLKLAVLGLGEFYEENRRQAFNTLWDMAHEPHETALKAAEILAGHEALTKPQAEELLALVEKHPKAVKRHVFVALSGVLRTHPETRGQLIDAEVKKASSYGPEDLINLGLMLDQARAHRAMLVAIPTQKALLNRELCILRIKALTQTQQFSELEAMLTSRQGLPISKGHISVLGSYLSLQKGEVTNAMNALSLALKHAASESDVETVHRIAVMSEEQGWWDLAASSHQWMAESGKAESGEALQRLFNVATNKRDTALMLASAERIVQVKKGNIPALTNLAYLRLLLGSRIETVAPLIGKLDTQRADASEISASSSGALVSAFLCYRYGDKDGVRKNMSAITDWTLIPPGQRAVAATLLRFVGHESQAFDLAASLRPLALLTEEQELWKSSLK